jgi:hypothetical protein
MGAFVAATGAVVPLAGSGTLVAGFLTGEMGLVGLATGLVGLATGFDGLVGVLGFVGATGLLVGAADARAKRVNKMVVLMAVFVGL